jgi:hypothetical protein
LTLQIGRLNKIAVENPDVANAGAYKQTRRGSTDCAAADNDGSGGEEALLALFADAGKENLTRIPFVERVVQERAWHLVAGHRPS